MAKPIPQRKPGNSRKSGVKKKTKLVVPKSRPKGWAAIGFDISMSSIAGCILGYDRTLDKLTGPHFLMRRWSTSDHYFSRLEMAARAEECVHDLLADAKLFLNIDEIFIAVEEPFPPHGKFMGKGISSSLKQQAEISGAFLGGILRYGYKELYQIGNYDWRKVIADDLGITIHHSKWKDPALAIIYNCKPDNTGKFRAKQWGCTPGYAFQGLWPEEVPYWPDIIEKTGVGKIPRPEGSIAKAVQPDDRYDALAIAEWMRRELQKAGVI